MNCYICGEDREVAGYICHPCLEVEREEEASKKGLKLLPPEEAIMAMLSGIILETANGGEVMWNRAEKGFVTRENNQPYYCFSGLYIRTWVQAILQGVNHAS